MNNNNSTKTITTIALDTKSSLDKNEKSQATADDDVPPVLEPEATATEAITTGSILLHGGIAAVRHARKRQQDDQTLHQFNEELSGDANIFEDEFYVNNGVLYQTKSGRHAVVDKQRPTENYLAENSTSSIHYTASDDTNICCGLCGHIVRYSLLINEHLPAFHPEVLMDGIVDLEEVPYESWLNEQQAYGGGDVIKKEIKEMSNIRHSDSLQHIFYPVRSTRPLRRISQYRVNTTEMTITELELALQKKMVEKMGRKVPVTLMDKLHAKCGICNTVISLNKKFEIVHLVRHFNAWHPSAHKCAGTWPNKDLSNCIAGVSTGKPLSAQDFAVIESNINAVDNLQCIWCGMFLSKKALGMHFHEVHPEEVEVPKCNLCLQELLINARLMERFGENFDVTLPDEHHYRSIRFKRDFRTEATLEQAIKKYQQRVAEGADPNLVDIEDMDPIETEEENEQEQEDLPSCAAFANSKLNCGRRAKPKREFIMPVVRQGAPPKNSCYVKAITHSHWKCKLCGTDIYAAVISAGVIKHYKKFHPLQLPEVQFELCQARLDKISDGNMYMVGDHEKRLSGTCIIECQICRSSFPMTPPFNICRAIRHIKIKHPEVMPEHKGGESSMEGFPTEEGKLEERVDHQIVKSSNDISYSTKKDDPFGEMEDGVIYAAEVVDVSLIRMLSHNYNVNFEQVYSIYGRDIDQQIYILTFHGDELDAQTVEEIVKVRDPTQNPMVVVLNKSDKQQQSS